MIYNAPNDFEKALLNSVATQSDVYPKALANFLFREIIEDAHVKYNISQEDIKAMCKAAVNRAAMFLGLIDNPKLHKAFAIYAIGSEEWDDAEITEDILEAMETLERLANHF